MSYINRGGPVFPRDHAHEGHNGLTACEYAAIQLKVPDSGTDWLDDMIRKSQRDDFAAKALPISYQFWMNDYYHPDASDAELRAEDDRSDFESDMQSLIAETAYAMANAMMEAREA